MANLGYIYLYRKLKEKGYYKKSQYIHLWIHLLLTANHTENNFLWNGKEQLLKKGQLITGRIQLEQETGIKQTTIERILDLLEKEGQIGQQKNNKFRVISILNWNKYQINKYKTDNKRTTNGQQTDNKRTQTSNVKNDKNDKKRGGFAPPSLNEVKNYCEERKNNVDPEQFINFYESKGWLIGKNKMKDWRAAVRTWENREKLNNNTQEEVIVPNYAKSWVK